MKVSIRLDSAMRFIGTNEEGKETYFDTSEKYGGNNSAASPVQILLQSLAACTAMDVMSLIKKRKKQISDFRVDVDSERAETHPRVFTKINLNYELISPDATLEDLDMVVKLSMEKYCSVSIMIKRSGCDVSWTTSVKNKK